MGCTLFLVAMPHPDPCDPGFQFPGGRLITGYVGMQATPSGSLAAMNGEDDPIADEILGGREHRVDTAIWADKETHGRIVNPGWLVG